MATIALYAGKINNMPSLIKDVRKSVEKYNKELAGLYQKTLKVDVGVCDLGEVMDGLRASSQTQEQRIEVLENFQENSEDFIQDAIRIDNNVADTVDQNKDDFYDKYDYLKPDCEKTIWDYICDGIAAIGEWCKEHWGEICIGLVCIVIGAVLTALTGGTFLAAFLAGLKFAAVSALITGGVNVLFYTAETLLNGGELSLSDAMTSFGDGLASGFMTGGIMAGLSMAVSAAFRFRAMNGVPGGPRNLRNGIRSYPDSLRPDGSVKPDAGGTIWNFASSSRAPGFRFDVDIRTLEGGLLPNYFHFHLPFVGTKSMPPLGIIRGHIPFGLYTSVGLGLAIANSDWYSDFKKWQREKWKQLFGS